MAIADVTIIPIGTETPSVSAYVADIQTILEGFEKEGKIKYRLTPMNTLIEGELSDLFQVIQTIHEAPFQKGIHRVATNIRIDDRRDKKTTMEGKLSSVQHHLNQ
ncbi:MTH1187 family thiamine-binding protein [Bacillus swezeyi]|uniref:Thiamine-binding protein n=1 Tax=Bacillus swezeyi TaxID=1925020 RepID=A0A1R1QAY2_9BACI|nr:MTH1187 family thiamine-binding protein [Bacillus swezeyi]KAA6451459.1 thiamine-binding protein [Bacillus swezeyi]KAA6482199.1 thiamine-binding protein [Bacillus swezeyi]MEC1261165.1 MTH1187 family thiamine-binding protein [Bacillus swezeyi]MED1739736.1 MTH1187 family thiamine-binding protein [Bacillus swezeyi]MED2929364.1 MTH1187 family thiamine-binding protein [Bacillus swezeyi]